MGYSEKKEDKCAAMDYISEIIVIINQLHQCAAVHSATVPVADVFKDPTIWEGEVEVFTLVNHPRAKKAYAWGYPKAREGRREITTVLEIPPVELSAAVVVRGTKNKS